MIQIEYITDSAVEGEPPPNFYWRGEPSDYLHLIDALHPLGIKNGVEVFINDLSFVKIVGQYNVYVKSSQGGKTLFHKDEDTIVVNLDSMLWREVLHYMFTASFSRCHNYIEFDNLGYDKFTLHLVEEANFIISSEA